MTAKFLIRHMQENELQIAIDWAQQEGWNPGLNDADCFYQVDPNGFFIGLLDGEPIATASSVIYSDQFAFCGLYIVKPSFRRQGYGIQLTQERLKYIGQRIAGIDGVLEQVSKYQRIGYQPAHKNIRLELSASPKTPPLAAQVMPLKTIPFEQIEAFERPYFPAPRPRFLQRWINQPQSFALGYVEKSLQGYGVIRKCYHGYKIGPLFATSPDIAEFLFLSLCSKVDTGPIYLDVPEPNSQALKMAKQHYMQPCFEVIRMYRNGFPNIDLQGIYGMTTYEIG